MSAFFTLHREGPGEGPGAAEQEIRLRREHPGAVASHLSVTAPL